MPDQKILVSALLDPAAVEPAGLRSPDGALAGKRFNVYRNNVVVGLTAALSDNFPVITRLLGEQGFAMLARLYLRAHPPETPVLMLWGAGLADFLQGFAPLAHLPYLADVARLEQARREAYHAADAPSIGAAELAAVPADDLPSARFALHPSLRLVGSAYPILDIWRYNMTDDRSPLSAQAQDVLVARPLDQVTMRVLKPGGLAFLQALSDGRPLDAAAGIAAFADPAFDLTAQLVDLIDARILTGIQT